MISPELMIRNDTATDSYQGVLDGQLVGLVTYKRFGDRVVVRHTVIEPEFRGSGLGQRLVQGVLDDLIGHRLTLTNYCPFVGRFLDGHPAYQRIVDPSRPGTALRGEEHDSESGHDAGGRS